jgi:hypothetical protein
MKDMYSLQNKKDKIIKTNKSIYQNDNNLNVNVGKQMLGFLIFATVFIITIPYLLLKSGNYLILEGYIPNIDMIASVVGFQREPFLNFKSYFKYLYNPDIHTIYGYHSQLIINYLALLGLTFFISYYTYKTKDILKGWSRAFFMLPLTYLLPGNLIAYYMSKMDKYLKNNQTIENIYIQDIIVYGVGIACILLFIITEKVLIEYFSDTIVSILKNMRNSL